MDHAINDDPAAELENSKVQVPEPEPFELHEVEQILADLAAHALAPIVSYFTDTFFTGIRPSELIAIRWADVDFNRRIVRVQRAIVCGKAKATTKTNTVRDVERNDARLPPSKRSQGIPATRGPGVQQPRYREAMGRHSNAVGNLERVPATLQAALPGPVSDAATHVRHPRIASGGSAARICRDAPGARHTGMLFKVYSKWIDGADNQRERAKLDAAFVHDLCTPRRSDVTNN